MRSNRAERNNDEFRLDIEFFDPDRLMCNEDVLKKTVGSLMNAYRAPDKEAPPKLHRENRDAATAASALAKASALRSLYDI
jgi:hypothetical protein